MPDQHDDKPDTSSKKISRMLYIKSCQKKTFKCFSLRFPKKGKNPPLKQAESLKRALYALDAASATTLHLKYKYVAHAGKTKKNASQYQEGAAGCVIRVQQLKWVLFNWATITIYQAAQLCSCVCVSSLSLGTAFSRTGRPLPTRCCSGDPTYSLGSFCFFSFSFSLLSFSSFPNRASFKLPIKNPPKGS